jgi:hypothetical protein
MIGFWDGFCKRADASTGGGGFSGVGKGNLPTGYAEQGKLMGSATGGDAQDSGLTDKTLLDRQRNPKDFSIRELGEDQPSEVIPQIIY